MLIFPNTAWLVPPSYAKRIHFLMAASKETPKKLAFASNSNKESFRANSCRLCKCDLKYKLVILHGIYLLKIFLIPLTRKVLKKKALDKLIHEHLGVTVIKTPEYSCRVCSKCALKIWNDVELLCFVKENINPRQPIAIAAQEEDLNIGETKEQQRWKRMSKSPSSAEKAKSAKIPCTEQQLTLELKRGFRVRKSFSFGQEPVDLNSDSQKEAARLRSMEIHNSSQEFEDWSPCEVKVIYDNADGKTFVWTPNDKITRSLIKNILLQKWKNAAYIVFKHPDMEPCLVLQST